MNRRMYTVGRNCLTGSLLVSDLANSYKVRPDLFHGIFFFVSIGVTAAVPLNAVEDSYTTIALVFSADLSALSLALLPRTNFRNSMRLGKLFLRVI